MKYSGSDVQLAPTLGSRKWSIKFQACVRSGRRPVMKLLREGLRQGSKRRERVWTALHMFGCCFLLPAGKEKSPTHAQNEYCT